MSTAAAFQGPSPYDDVVGKLCAKNEEDWGAILDLCDKITSEKEKGAKDALKAIVNKVSSPNPKVGVMAVTLLRACFNNCGRSFQTECAQAPLMDEIKRLLETKANTPFKVCEALKEMLQDWVLDTGSDSALSRIYSTYNKLKSDGYSFPHTDRPFPQPPVNAYSTADDIAAREQADLERAITESLKLAEAQSSKQKETPTKKKGKKKSDSSATIYPGSQHDAQNTAIKPTGSTTSSGAKRRVKALYTFEVQEAGELGFKAGDVVVLLDDSHPDWWKGELNGETGLFPSNYVEVIKEVPVLANGTAAAVRAPGGFDPSVIDDLLERLLTAQTSATDAAFNAEIERLYDIVVGEMQPAVLAKIDQLNAKEVELSRLNEAFCTSMAMYEKLQRDGELALSGQFPQQAAYGAPYGHPGGQQPGTQPRYM